MGQTYRQGRGSRDVATSLLCLVEVVLHFGKVEVGAGRTTEDVQDVDAGCLEVTCRIVSLGNKNLRKKPIDWNRSRHCNW